MRFPLRATLLALVIIAIITFEACSGGRPALLGPDYEYEEDLTLSLDGSATLTVNASMQALAALHGLHLNADPRSRADVLKSEARAAFTSPYSEVTGVSVWTRDGRRFVGVRLRVPDVRQLSKATPFAWSAYDLHEEGDLAIYRQTVTGKGSPDPNAGWRGDELIAFRLRLPARIRFHNSRDFRTGAVRDVGRGNILTWEQTLRDRLDGKPIAWSGDHRPGVMEAHMDRESILYRTLWLFGIAFTAAIVVLAGLIWLTIRRGVRTDPTDPASSGRPH
ncbi:MAG TPA: hypothetical protein VH138_14980 [Vicinamibacterales bacterium]|jgi:hypothetical protein|nr:hypothetical protein [Vicinamibacterales bacterium]